MSYVVLARKYRPMFFQDVIGQQHVTQTLQNAIEQDRIANAYLFSGPRGVGKTTVARLLSKALNCDNGPTINPCNACSSCVEVNESRSLDVLEIDGASNRGIDEVRNLRESLRYSPNPGKYRIYIIDEVHMLTNEAFNALLKTLEEPPSRVLFIFATTESHKVPATILSRCQKFDFKRITIKKITEQLKSLCEKENVQIDDESMRLIANKGDGSMRDSQSILDQIIAFSGMTIKAEDTANLLGIISHDLFFRVTDLIQNKDVQSGIHLVHNVFTEGYDFNEFLIGLAEHFRNFMVVQSTGTADELNVSEDDMKKYSEQAEVFTIEDLLRMIKIASDTENLIRKSTNARLHLEVAITKMIKMSSSVQLSQLFSQLEEAKKKTDVAITAAPTPTPQQPQSIPENKQPENAPLVSTPRRFTPPIPTREQKLPDKPVVEVKPTDNEENVSMGAILNLTLEQIEKKWPSVLEHVRREKVGFAALLSEAWPTRLHGHFLELSFDKNKGFQMSQVQRQSEYLENICEQVLDANLKVRCVKAEEEILHKVQKVAPMDRKSQFESYAKENETVQKIIEKFDAEFVK